MTMAKLATGYSGFICTNAAYHGNSQQVMQLARRSLEHSGTGNVCAFPFPDILREDSGLGNENDLLVCPIVANEGLPNIPSGFMRAAIQLVHAVGGLVIADEV